MAFVAMKRNIDDLPEVLKIAQRLGAMHFKVSNVLAIDEQLRGEMLYESAAERHHLHVVALYAAPESAQDAVHAKTTRDALVQGFPQRLTTSTLRAAV